jgi:GAF domain-containing protein
MRDPLKRLESLADYQQWLGTIAKCIAETIGDGCVMRLLSSGGWLTPVAIHLPFEDVVADEAVVARLRAHVSTTRHVTEQDGARRVVETGVALRVPHLDRAQLEFAATPAIAQAFETIGIHSLLFVALRRRETPIGLLAMVRFAPGSPPYKQHDQDIVQAVADHIALAIDDARSLGRALSDADAPGGRRDDMTSSDLASAVVRELGVATDLIRNHIHQSGDLRKAEVLKLAARLLPGAD